MSLKIALLRGATVGAFVAFAAGAAHADAAATHKTKHHKRHVAAHAPARVVQPAATAEEVRALKEEIEALRARLDTQAQAQQATAAQVAETQVKVAEASQNAASADEKVEMIPEQVNVAVGQLPKPKTDKIYIGPVGLKFGGFVAAEGIYRSRALGADIATSFSAIPFSGPGSTASGTGNSASVGHTQELRATARQSRISGQADADVDANTHLQGYGEFDFQAAAQTANSNQTNSYNPRIRVLYATLDRNDLGLHFLAGQNWSLATMNSKGITPHSEAPPPVIDAQYIPGFVFTRQPQFRIADQLTPQLWVAGSLENPQTTFAGGATAPGAALRVINLEAAGSGFNSANTLSLNHLPDVILKAAYEPTVFDRQLHFEVFGIFDDFYTRTAAGITINPPVAPSTTPTITESATQNQNNDVYGGGVGFGAMIPVAPKLLDFQFSGLVGNGVGRYGAGALADVTFRQNGTVQPIHETLFLTGATLHATPTLDIYAFGGQEQASKAISFLGATGYGYGNPNYNNSGCFGESLTTACTGQTRTLTQAVLGFWDRVYQGPFGSFRVGVEYSYTERKAFLGVGGAPSTSDNMIFTSVRYYPFN